MKSIKLVLLTITSHTASPNGNIAEETLMDIDDMLHTAHDEATIYKGPLSNDNEYSPT